MAAAFVGLCRYEQTSEMKEKFSDEGLFLIAKMFVTHYKNKPSSENFYPKMITDKYREVDFVGLYNSYGAEFTYDKDFGEDNMVHLIMSATKDGFLFAYDIDEDIYIIKA